MPSFSIPLSGLDANSAALSTTANNLANLNTIGYLRIVFDCSLVSAEHLTFLEFMERLPEKSYISSVDLSPASAVGVLQLDLAVAFPIIDVMLGGEGGNSEITRDVTEIEEQVLEGIIRIMCRELQTAWQAIQLEFNFGARHQLLQTQRLMPPEEKNLCLSFEIRMSETRGTLNLAIPAVVSNALLRKISVDFSYQRRRGSAEARQRIQKKLLSCSFPVELSMPGLQVPLEVLNEIAPGQVLAFPRDAQAPGDLLVDDVWLARRPRCGSIRGAPPAFFHSNERFPPPVSYERHFRRLPFTRRTSS